MNAFKKLVLSKKETLIDKCIISKKVRVTLVQIPEPSVSLVTLNLDFQGHVRVAVVHTT